MHVEHHSERAFSVPGFLGPAECAALIDLAEGHGFDAASVRTTSGPQMMKTVRNNDRVIIESPPWVQILWQRLSALALPVLDGEAPAGLPVGLRFYRYGPGQRFKMHKDGPWTEAGLTSKLTFLVYLNDGFEGGATGFRDFEVRPAEGTALLFVHDTWHEGAPVLAGTKYVLRSDVLYRPAPR